MVPALAQIDWDCADFAEVRDAITAGMASTVKQAADPPAAWQQHLGAGLAGAGVGAAAGLLKEYLSLNKKKLYAENAMTGGLLGALVGSGGSLAVQAMNDLNAAAPPAKNPYLNPDAAQRSGHGDTVIDRIYQRVHAPGLAEGKSEKELRDIADAIGKDEVAKQTLGFSTEGTWNQAAKNLLRVPTSLWDNARASHVSGLTGVAGAGIGYGLGRQYRGSGDRALLLQAIRQDQVPTEMHNYLKGTNRGALAEMAAQLKTQSYKPSPFTLSGGMKVRPGAGVPIPPDAETTIPADKVRAWAQTARANKNLTPTGAALRGKRLGPGVAATLLGILGSAVPSVWESFKPGEGTYWGRKDLSDEAYRALLLQQGKAPSK